MHEQLHWSKATFLKQQHHIPPYALRQKKQFTNKNQHGKWHHWNTWSSCQTHYLFHPAMRHGLLGDSATRKHAQAVQSVCKWWWLAGIVTTWNPNDPCFDWFRAFLWRVGALLFRKQDLGNHYISSTWFSWKEENFLSYSLPFWGDVLWRSVWRLKIWGPQPYGCPNPKRKRTISKWFRKFSQFNLHQVTTKRKNWLQIHLKHCFSRCYRFCQYSWPWHLYLHLFHQWKTSAKSLTTG